MPDYTQVTSRYQITPSTLNTITFITILQCVYLKMNTIKMITYEVNDLIVATFNKTKNN